MIEIRPFSSLGGGDFGWLKTRHHFSFADYHDPARMNWGRLRVWNDDEIAPGTGFDPHPHRDMEIITYVRSGAITHVDNLGNEGRTEAGDVQIMSAGTGIVHGEYNREAVTTRIFQIWILPDRRGAKPAWGSKEFPHAGRDAAFAVLASGRAGDAGGGALALNADAALLAASLKAGQVLRQALPTGRAAYLVPATGAITMNGVPANARDGVAVKDERTLEITAREDSELVLVDVAD
jgi:redox-sensitive bicupin YhaK (pirin superfamily)